MGTQPPNPKGAEPLILGPHLLWPNGCMDQDATWYAGRPRPTQHCVRCGPSYPQKKGHTHPTQFLAHVYCGQRDVWMKTPLGTEVDLGPGNNVLDGAAAPRERGTAAPPLFVPCTVWPRLPISAAAELLFQYWYCSLQILFIQNPSTLGFLMWVSVVLIYQRDTLTVTVQ